MAVKCTAPVWQGKWQHPCAGGVLRPTTVWNWRLMVPPSERLGTKKSQQSRRLQIHPVWFRCILMYRRGEGGCKSGAQCSMRQGQSHGTPPGKTQTLEADHAPVPRTLDLQVRKLESHERNVWDSTGCRTTSSLWQGDQSCHSSSLADSHRALLPSKSSHKPLPAHHLVPGQETPSCQGETTLSWPAQREGNWEGWDLGTSPGVSSTLA